MGGSKFGPWLNLMNLVAKNSWRLHGDRVETESLLCVVKIAS